jgi:hypothetical protein
MTNGRIKSRDNLIEGFRRGKSESLDLDFSYHLEVSFLTFQRRYPGPSV